MNRILTFSLLSFFLVSSAGAEGALLFPAAVDLSHLSAGQYVATVSPAPNQETANVIQNALRDVPGVDVATIFGGSQALRITIVRGYDVNVEDLQEAVRNVDPGLAVSTPQRALDDI